MDPTVYVLFIFGISIASARHTFDVNEYLVQSQIDPKYNLNEQFSSQDVERRIDYESDVNSKQEVYSDAPLRIEQSVYSDHQRQHHVDSSYVTESDHVALISEKVDSSNNIGNDGNEFKLRTNAYPTTRLEIMEFTTESINSQRQMAHTHLEEQNVQGHYSESEFNARERSRTENNNQRNTHNHRIDQQRSLDMAPQTRYIPQVVQTSEKYNELSSINVKDQNNMQAKMIKGSAVQRGPVESKNHVPESVNVRPLEESSTRQSSRNDSMGSRGVEESDRIPKEKDEEEIPWVWGTQPGTKLNTTEVDDLDDRAAFDGSPCATGYVKVMGICVEKH